MLKESCSRTISKLELRGIEIVMERNFPLTMMRKDSPRFFALQTTGLDLVLSLTLTLVLVELDCSGACARLNLRRLVLDPILAESLTINLDVLDVGRTVERYNR